MHNPILEPRVLFGLKTHYDRLCFVHHTKGSYSIQYMNTEYGAVERHHYKSHLSLAYVITGVQATPTVERNP